MKNLKHFNIVITRAIDQAQETAQEIITLGATPIFLPCIEIQFLNFDKTILTNNFDIGIFLSANAVTALHDQKLKAGVFFAIGKKTAISAERLVQNKVQYPKNHETTEGLLTLPELANIKDKKIILFKGLGGRETLKDHLTKLGAIVTELNLYRRITPQSINYSILKTLDLTKTIILITSGEILDNLMQQLPAGLRDSVLNTEIVVKSERLKHLAHQYGFNNIVLDFPYK